jgi:4-hydroxy-3-methylbut-2-en-1-yl diphosphate synthase IspG/GcpE
MCTTLTSDVNATLQQIAELTASGCQIVRVAVPSQDDADALAQIAKKSQIPVIADIHFQPNISLLQSMQGAPQFASTQEISSNLMTKLKRLLKLPEMPEFQFALA